MSGRKRDDSPNPDFNRPAPPEDHPDARKARLFRWHSLQGTMGIYYELFPEDRPAEPEPAPSRGHSR
jgi:hypothetical protein